MAASTVRNKGFDAKVLREFPRVGRYHVRLMEGSRGNPEAHALDIREYLQTEEFTGYTRRGIRLYTGREAAELAEALRQVMEDEALPEQSSGGRGAR